VALSVSPSPIELGDELGDNVGLTAFVGPIVSVAWSTLGKADGAELDDPGDDALVGLDDELGLGDSAWLPLGLVDGDPLASATDELALGEALGNSDGDTVGPDKGLTLGLIDTMCDPLVPVDAGLALGDTLGDTVAKSLSATALLEASVGACDGAASGLALGLVLVALVDSALPHTPRSSSGAHE